MRDGSVKVVDPLVIVNGVRIEDINTIDPNSIKSFQVLKDEDAIKLYGDEGKNGVIVIETKDRGKAAEPKTKEHWVDADSNDVLFGGDKYAWKNAKAKILEDLNTGELTVQRVKGFEVDGKRLSNQELQAYTTDENLAYYITEEGILTVMTTGYLQEKAAERRAGENK